MTRKALKFNTIIYDVQDRIATIAMNRPIVRNGLNIEMVDELRAAVGRAMGDSDVRVLQLRGEGKVFCSGADLGEMNTDSDPALQARQGEAGRALLRDHINPLVHAIYYGAKPVIAVVQGAAVGGGVGLALATDLVVAAEDARFILNFTPAMALIPDLGSTWTLPRLLGRSKTMGLTLLGETVTGGEAERLGMIWRACPAADLTEEARGLAARVASGPPLAMGMLKAALRDSARNDFGQQLEREMELAASCGASPDFTEAIAAFKEKRRPVF